ncbi:MAG TPA: sensor histidine kinase [Nitrososphaeraceae archaeon]|nr:sensor histidine kinase [Nitrososphaeraceae archaeon]
MNSLKGKAKLLATVSIVLIIAVSYGLFFYLENTSEQNIRNRMIEQEVQNQLKYMQAISRHIGTDLTVVVDNLHGLANSKYIQQGDLSSNKTKRLAQETYSRLNGRDSTIDRLVIVDKKGFETVGLTTKGEKIFAGTKISLRPWARETLKSKAPTYSNGFVGLDGQYRIAIGYPITNLENGQYTGLLGALVPFETFLSQYGNVHNPNSKYLVAYDKNATILVTAMSKALIGKNFFADYSQQFIKHNKVLTDFVSNLLAGKPGYAIYNYGEGESLSTGYPIYVNGKAAYFIRIVAPTTEIYSHINDVLFNERVKMFSLIAGITAAIAILIVFLIKWSSLSEEVKRRGKQLEEANKELETANKQLSLSNEQLNIRDKAQQEFINVAAHELRTPIQPIISLSDILMHKIIDNESRPLMDTILRNARRLQRLSQDILDVTKIESGLLNLNKEYLNLKEVISDTINDYRNQIKNSKRNIRVVYEFDKEETKQGEGVQQQKQLHKQLLTQDTIHVKADKGRLTQVVDNLLGNALKFTEEGDNISVSVESKDGHAVVSVKDTGRGIDPEIFPRLFQKFATKSETGTGLGLFICKGIIEAHGGKIWAENNDKGNGATFYFSLPCLTNGLKG